MHKIRNFAPLAAGKINIVVKNKQRYDSVLINLWSINSGKKFCKDAKNFNKPALYHRNYWIIINFQESMGRQLMGSDILYGRSCFDRIRSGRPVVVLTVHIRI